MNGEMGWEDGKRGSGSGNVGGVSKSRVGIGRALVEEWSWYW